MVPTLKAEDPPNNNNHGSIMAASEVGSPQIRLWLAFFFLFLMIIYIFIVIG